MTVVKVDPEVVLADDSIAGDRRVVECAGIPAQRDLAITEARGRQVRNRIRAILHGNRDEAPHEPVRIVGRVSHLVLKGDVARRGSRGDRDRQGTLVGARDDLHTRGKGVAVETPNGDDPQGLACERVGRLVVREHVDGRRGAALTMAWSAPGRTSGRVDWTTLNSIRPD